MESISWLLAELKEHENAVSAIKDIATVALAILGLIFLGWRNWVMQKSARAALSQAKTANKQAETAAQQAQTAAKQAEIAEQNFNHTAELSRKSQLNDQYVKAIDQLGHKDDIAVRLGGIYGLEKLAHASGEYYRQAIEVLTAYVREHAKEPEEDELYEPQKDVQAILTVLGRAKNDGKVAFDLSYCYLPEYTFKGDFKQSILSRTNLTRTSCQETNFSNAICIDANFSKANCIDANFSEADCSEVNFSKANCIEANFSEADCGVANFSEADCSAANFSEADCNAVNFSKANCIKANFSGADCRVANFSGAKCFLANFSEANCRVADFSEADYRKANFSKSLVDKTRGLDLD